MEMLPHSLPLLPPLPGCSHMALTANNASLAVTCIINKEKEQRDYNRKDGIQIRTK